MPLSNPSATVSFPASNTATRINVSASITAVTLFVSSPARKGGTIWNNSSANLYIEFGSSLATTSVFAVKISADGYYEIPFNYTGSLNGIWDVANGSALVRELT